ncbi:MAG: DNA polymerase IV [Dehalococcoidia bacterium]|nr:DNA polymerase IV [Dehalococcoidia bacterium]
MGEWPRPWRYIFHADMDAFFASVAQRDDPSLRDKPIVVGGPPESRGVVAAASYEARKLGARSAMPMATALRLSPDIIRVGHRKGGYGNISRQVMTILQRVTPHVQQISVDEAYMDVTDVAGPEMLEPLGREIKRRVRRATGLAVTIGGGVTRTVAKVASQVGKPDGLLIVPPATEDEFLAPLDVSLLSGVGPVTLRALNARGIRTMGQLAEADDDWLAKEFGTRGAWLKERSLGGGSSELEFEDERQAKSISSETTMRTDTDDGETLSGLVRDQGAEVVQQMRRSGLIARTVRLKLRLADFTTFTRQQSLPRPTDDEAAILAVADELLRRELAPGREFRLIGVGVASLEPALDQPQEAETGPATGGQIRMRL